MLSTRELLAIAVLSGAMSTAQTTALAQGDLHEPLISTSFETSDGSFDRSVCEPQWHSWGGVPGLGASIDTVVIWDSDGDGPAVKELIAAGDFPGYAGERYNRLARWNGINWEPFGAAGIGSPSSSFVSLFVWHENGSSSAPSQLVATGDFTKLGSTVVNRIARWDGTAWHPLGSGFTSIPRDMCLWDSDGPGPLPMQLTVVVGSGARRWDGATWQLIGEGVSLPGGVPSLDAITTWDPDGDGPQPPTLVVAGKFSAAGTVAASNIAIWNGTQWEPLGAGTGDQVWDLATWDQDGEGPSGPLLIASGAFTTVGGMSARRIASWDGSQWSPLSTGLNGWTVSLATWDPDGDGPQTDQLIAGGSFSTAGGVPAPNIARWDGVQWTSLGPGLSGSQVKEIVGWDMDQDTSTPDQLVASGGGLAGDVDVDEVARWDGSKWHPFGLGLSNGVRALIEWDPESAHGERRVAAGGFFRSAGGVAVNKIAAWLSGEWQSMAGGAPSGSVSALIEWDPDGEGPMMTRLIAAGSFTSIGGQAHNRISQWDGAHWYGLGSGASSSVTCLGLWDPDGHGPLSQALIAGGNFAHIGGVTVNRVGAWNGTVWQSLGGGVFGGDVQSVTSWDLDGPGPASPHLVVAGYITGTGNGLAKFIASWNGEQWMALGSGTNSSVNAVISWDPDQEGPETPLLIAGGRFTTAGGTPANYIARWDGSNWLPMGTGFNGVVEALAIWDPDGDGSQSHQLIAAGAFTSAGATQVSRIARWNGSEWLPLGDGLNETVYAMASWDPDGDGPMPTRLVVGGDFTVAAGIPAGYIAWWGCPVPPPCPADVNADTLVDILDFLDFIDAFGACNGQPAPCGGSAGTAADYNADTLVDILDFLDFLDNFGNGC